MILYGRKWRNATIRKYSSKNMHANDRNWSIVGNYVTEIQAEFDGPKIGFCLCGGRLPCIRVFC